MEGGATPLVLAAQNGHMDYRAGDAFGMGSWAFAPLWGESKEEANPSTKICNEKSQNAICMSLPPVKLQENENGTRGFSKVV
eukprot:2799392-Amphidinium_carterae.1